MFLCTVQPIYEDCPWENEKLVCSDVVFILRFSFIIRNQTENAKTDAGRDGTA